MRKKTIKTCLNVIIGFLSMFFLSCQHDEFIEQSKNNDFIFKTITLNEVKSHSDKAATLFTKSTKSSKFNKTSSATEIDSSNVIYLERKNGFKSFTYRLKDDVSLNQFNNIVVYEFPDGSNKVFTVKYLLNKSLLEATKENNLKSSIIGYETSVLKFNNPYQKAASYSCISIGYWVVVDKCEGELVTPENNPGCFNSDGSRATREVFITMEENCSYSAGGSNTGEIYVGGSPTDFLDNGGGGAGLTSFDGIFIPNPYELGEEDPRNADFNYSMQVSQYLNTITSWKSLLYQANTYGGISTYWMQPFFVDYFKKNGGLTTENKNIVKSVIDRFNEIYTNENAYKVYENSTERNLINYKLFQTLTNYPTISAKTIQDIFIFRAQNFWSSESVNYTQNLLEYCNQNGNTPEIIEEAKNILDIIDDGKINGQQVVVAPEVAITNMADYLKCFNTSQPATITIYADQPKNGEHNLISTTDGVGHAFISIKQGNNVATLGFYPKSSVNSIIPNNLTLDPTDFFPTPGVFGNDQGHAFDVSMSVPINAAGLTNLINGFISIAAGNPVYNLGTSNCTDIAILAFESQANINIPSCESPNPLWNGQTPGTLGEVLRNMPTPSGGTKNTSGGSAPNNNCN